MRGFDIRGIGPRILREFYNVDGSIADTGEPTTDSIGGRAYYLGRLEVEVPVSANIRSLGLRPSVFIDAGSVFGITKPFTENLIGRCTPQADNPSQTVIELRPTSPAGDFACRANALLSDSDPARIFNYETGYRETFLGNSAKPRLSIGVGVNWQSPFGPLRIDLAKALLKQEGDETKLFSFNVGTQF